MDSLTVLLCRPGFTAAKSWTDPQTCRDYNAGSLTDPGSVPISGIDQLAAALDRLRQIPNAYVIRGELRPGTPTPCVRRSKQPTDPFEERARHWVMIDVDSLPDTDGTFASDPASAAAGVRASLDPAFRNARCYWHASSSAGIKPGIRLHLWFWCSRPVESVEWRQWAKQWRLVVDTSVYRTVQPHYTADPTLAFPDPMAARSGILAGEPEVTVPAIVGANDSIRALADQTLDRALRKIRAAKEGDRNNTLYSQAARVAAFAPLLGDRARSALEAAALETRMGATEAIGTIESAFDRTPLHPACDTKAWSRGLETTQAGGFSSSPGNILLVLRQHPELSGLLELDSRTNELRVSRPPPWDEEGRYPRTLTDFDAHDFVIWLSKEAKITGAPPRIALEAMMAACQKRRVDRFKDWLETLEHDGVPRLERWLAHITGSQDPPPYLAAVGKRWLISAVARTFEPGCKADCMLVLVGAQGLRKSTLFERLAGAEWYRVNQATMGSDDAYMQLQGPVIVEMSDLAGMSGRAVEMIKADMSTACDERRPKYGRMVVKFPRRCVYAGTTNDDTFLHDATGGRRFWPVHVEKFIDTDWVTEHRDQLWAEAVALYRSGEQWHLTSDENQLAILEQENAREEDSLEERIEMWLRQTKGLTRLTVAEVAAGIEWPVAQVKPKRFKNALNKLGWFQHRSHGVRWYTKGEP